MIFEKIQPEGHEQLLYCQDPSVGLKAIIAIHSSVLGAATGGCRMWHYSSEEEALQDVLRLSKGMTQKAALAGLDWGGGKAVILADEQTSKKSPEELAPLFERFGEFVDRLGGAYVTAKDVGIHAQSLKIIKRKTRHVLGIDGEPGSSGDPSLATAWGVYHGMRACAQFAFQAKSLKGLKIALQGLGCVSYDLLEHLVSEGAIVIGCDIHPQRVEKIVKKYSIEIVSPERIYDVECDIFSPSALGSSIRPETLERIQAKVIAGAANNQLASPEQGYEIMRRGIVYAPDYVINAGGLINVYYENPKEGSYNRTLAFEHVSRIGGTLTTILERAQDENLPSDVIADRLVDERIQLALKKRNSSALR